MGGVINIITKQPTNKTAGFVELNLGTFGTQRYTAGVPPYPYDIAKIDSAKFEVNYNAVAKAHDNTLNASQHWIILEKSKYYLNYCISI